MGAFFCRVFGDSQFRVYWGLLQAEGLGLRLMALMLLLWEAVQGFARGFVGLTRFVRMGFWANWRRVPLGFCNAGAFIIATGGLL